ncbi:hypothetical protein K443DRAFT_618258 [Laccaria amethystina LaAM-08-1]|uniref:Uncharacterized protein n=1 Tax=Laccaria amethystina LaAM-08-1 TaxID=1095629 RepID=A0A0C9XER8_9AGAR|nr:hypothetical protein K443DRAFT_618258 [Laccaria amethystina LaAM-08-1]
MRSFKAMRPDELGGGDWVKLRLRYQSLILTPSSRRSENAMKTRLLERSLLRQSTFCGAVDYLLISPFGNSKHDIANCQRMITRSGRASF